MAVYFASDVRRRSVGPRCELVVEVLLNDHWLESWRTCVMDNEQAFIDAQDHAYALIPLLRALKQGPPVPSCLLKLIARFELRLAPIVFQFNTLGPIEFYLKYHDLIDVPVEIFAQEWKTFINQWLEHRDGTK